MSVPILLYARTGAENNKVEPQVNLLGQWEAVDHFFFVESAINVSQQYVTAFGPTSESLANATNNRYTSQSYRVTPYIKSARSDYSYELRDDNIWTRSNADLANRAYTNDLVGTLQRHPVPFGWALDIDRNDTKFEGQPRQLLELARIRGLYQIDPQVQVWLTGGYEHNDLLLETTSGPIYGAGVKWRPNERTNLEASYEHRFFGPSYNFIFDNRTPLTVWRVAAIRNVTNYPQQVATLPAGADIAGALNQLFLSRFPDPTARQNAIDQFIRQHGLPSSLSSAVVLLSQQVTLQQSVTATAGFIGARNNIFFTAYTVRQQPVAGETLTGELGLLANNTQNGGNIVWTHALTPLVSLTGSIEGSRANSHSDQGSTKQGAVRLAISTPIAPLTTVYGGFRYQVQRSTATSAVTNDFNEAAVFVGVTHRFH